MGTFTLVYFNKVTGVIEKHSMPLLNSRAICTTGGQRKVIQ